MKGVAVKIIIIGIFYLMVLMPVFSAPSGLNTIPTADVLDRGVVSLEMESGGSGLLWGDDCDRFFLLQFGLGSGFEAGIDRCLHDPDTWLNVKWRLRDDSGNLPAFAVGVQGISKGELAQPYAVVTKSIGDARLHTGAARIDRGTRWMLGVDRPLNDRVILQADYISGEENFFTYGISISLNDNLSLTLVRSLGNAPDTDNGYIANLGWSVAIF